jgi:hypothetical protein
VDWSVWKLTSKTCLVAGVILFSLLFTVFSFSDNTIHALSTTPSPSPTIFADFAVVGSAGPGGKISPSGSQFAYPGSSFTFTITPNSGYKISDVIVDGVSQGPISTYSFTNVQAGHEISATFTIETTSSPLEIVLIAILVAVVVLSLAVIVKRRAKRKRIERES